MDIVTAISSTIGGLLKPNTTRKRGSTKRRKSISRLSRMRTSTRRTKRSRRSYRR